MLDVRRSIYATIMMLFSFAAIIFVLFVRPNPERWYHNMTASGFAPFMTAILLAVYAVPGWLVCYGLLMWRSGPKPPAGAGRK